MHSRFVALLIFTVVGCKKEQPPAEPQAAALQPIRPATPPPPASPTTIALEVTEEGFVPANLTVKAGKPLLLVVTRTTEETCANEILIEGTDIKKDLPLNKPVKVAWTPTKAGKVKFGCAMDMMTGGVILVE